MFNQKLKVLLVASNFCRENEPHETYGASCLSAAFNEGRSKGQLRAEDSLEIFTCDLNKFLDRTTGIYSIHWEKIADEICRKVREGGYNVVAFSVFGWFEKAVKIASKEMASWKVRPYIMMGGASIVKNEKKMQENFPYADYFNVSYGEKIFGNLREYLSNQSKFLYDLPDFRSLQSPYLTGEIRLTEKINSIRVETRRGCPFRCSFCKHRDTVNSRVYDIGCFDRHIREIELFKSAGIKKLNILDPFFNDKQGHGKLYLELLRRLDFNGEVTLQIRPELLTEDFVQEATLNKNLVFEIGVQSMEPEVLKLIRRGGEKTPEQVKEKAKLCNQYGIKTMVSLIYGLPLQSYDGFARDVDFFKALNENIKVSAFPLQIYRGTFLDSKIDLTEYGLVKAENCFGIPEVVDSVNGDFHRMKNLAAQAH